MCPVPILMIHSARLNVITYLLTYLLCYLLTSSSSRFLPVPFGSQQQKPEPPGSECCTLKPHLQFSRFRFRPVPVPAHISFCWVALWARFGFALIWFRPVPVPSGSGPDWFRRKKRPRTRRMSLSTSLPLVTLYPLTLYLSLSLPRSLSTPSSYASLSLSPSMF